jgi:hypothetical protein
VGWTFYNASGQQLRNTGTVLATQAEMEAGSSIAAFVTPGRTQFHPGVAKAWCHITQGGALGSGDYNVASVSDDGVGEATITWDVDFADGNYIVVTDVDDGSAAIRATMHQSRVVGSILRKIRNVSEALVDSPSMTVAHGDQ